MKRLNKKGFTLIELLAVIIILGVLLLIAVPSVSKYITNSRMDTYETNLSKLVDAVSNEVNSYSDNYTFSASQYLIVPLTCVEVERGSNSESPFGPYIQDNSFIVVTRKYETGSNVPVGFNYYVAALDVNGFGTNLSLIEDVAVQGTPTAVQITKSTKTGATDRDYDIPTTAASTIPEIFKTENGTSTLALSGVLPKGCTITASTN